MTRLTEERVAELYTGTLRLVAEQGFDRVTMDAIAEATHSSKATLYRQWGSKTGLVAAALEQDVDRHHVDVDTGALRTDLIAMLTRPAPTGVEDSALIGSLLHAVKTDAELASVLREKVIALGRERIGVVIDRAVARGEVDPASTGIEHTAFLIIAQFVLDPLINASPHDEATQIRYIDEVLLPVLAHH